MATAITHVQPGSIAERLGLQPGDQLVSIAGEPIIDQIDYQALMSMCAGADPPSIRSACVSMR